MATIIPVRGIMPKIDESCFLAPDADIIGEVTLGRNSSVWFKAILRGDVHYIKIGEESNIQDAVVIHGTYQKAPTNIGNRVSIGHSAVIHGCTIHDHVLVGIGAIITDDVVVEEMVFVAAGAVVTPGTRLESGFLYGGVPARKLKPLDEALKKTVLETPDRYIHYKTWF